MEKNIIERVVSIIMHGINIPAVSKGNSIILPV
jgi:hypothetical protein